MQKYNLFQEAPAGECALLSFLEALNEPEWGSLIEDIVQDHPNAYVIFMPDRGEELLSQSSTFLCRLGIPTQRTASLALESVLNRHKSDATLVGRALTFARVLPQPGLRSLLRSFVLADETAPDIREIAADALANQAAEIPTTFWKAIDLKRYPELAGAVLAGLAEHSGFAAVEQLTQISGPPANLPSLHYPLRRALRRVLSEDGGKETVLEFASRSSPWIVELLDTVFTFSEFKDHAAHWRRKWEGRTGKASEAVPKSGLNDFAIQKQHEINNELLVLTGTLESLRNAVADDVSLQDQVSRAAGIAEKISCAVRELQFRHDPVPGIHTAAPRGKSQPLLVSGSPTILLVDDMEEVLKVTATTLEGAGCKVLTASGGIEAIRIAREYSGTIDLLISDIGMHDMPGPDVAREILQLRPNIREIFITGYADCLAASPGSSQPTVLMKPFNRDGLVGLVESTLCGA